jgi:hypothetical protein
MTAGFLPGTRARAVKEWKIIYADPIVVKAGEVVRLGKRDTEWPGWVWCTSEAGKSGWAPEALIEAGGDTGRIRSDYSAVELALQPGDLLVLYRELSGWYWATDEAGK